MTALDAYDRLEAVGILKRSAQDPGVEVVVTFGEATLTMNGLSADGDTPLTHWSLAAVDLIENSEIRAVYSLNAMSEETLEVEDETFRRALSRVLRDRSAQAPRAARSKGIKYLGLACVIAALGYAVLPGMVIGTAKRMISPERAAVLASDMIPMIEARTGPACATPLATAALAQLTRRLDPNGRTALFVHDLGDVDILSLPGDKVLINHAVLERARSNEEITAWAAIGIAGIVESPAITELFDGQGLGDGIRFLASGELPETAKTRAVNQMLIRARPVTDGVRRNANQLLINAGLDTNGLAHIFGAAQITPSAGTGKPVMTDQEWAALRDVCKG